MAAILFFSVHTHKDLWSLSLIGLTFDSLSGTCCIIIHTKFHGILATFRPCVPREVQQALCDMQLQQNISQIGVVQVKKVSTYTKGHDIAAYPWD